MSSFQTVEGRNSRDAVIASRHGHWLLSRGTRIMVLLGAALAVALAVSTGTSGAQAAGVPGSAGFLGAADSYAIIASNTVTDAGGASHVTGNVGLHPGTAVGLLPVQVSGHINTATTGTTGAALSARNALNAAYITVKNTGATETVGTANLAAQVTPYLAGVYFSGSDLLLDGTITLHGGPNDVFIFQASTAALSVASGSTVLLTGGAQWCNVYWQVGSSATIGTGAAFIGTVLAATSIEADTGAHVTGRLLASAANAGAVTLDHNVITSRAACTEAASTLPGGELPQTGDNSTVIVIIASAITLAGLLAVLFSRRLAARSRNRL